MANVVDFKDRSDKWVMTFKVGDKVYYTLAGRRYCNMRSRSNPEGSYQKDKLTYAGVTNTFCDFQDFADWASSQIGWENSDWELDKDLLVKGNRIYSKETCLIIPREINLFLNTFRKCRGKYLVGVSWKQRIKKFVSACANPETGELEHIGVYSTEFEAFRAYANFKEKGAKYLANKWKSQIDPRAYEALMNYQVEITD